MEPLHPVVRREHRRGVQVVHRDVEEALELVRVEIHREHAVGARGADEVGHQLGADRDPRLVLTVLPGVAEVGDHGRDAGGAGPARGVDQQQQLDEVLGGRVGRLDDVDVPAADVLVDLHEQLAVGEAADGDLAQRLLQLDRDLLGERPVGRPRQEHHVTLRERDFGHGPTKLTRRAGEARKTHRTHKKDA